MILVFYGHVPKRQPDETLRAAAQAAIQQYGSAEAAASAMGVASSTLWRAASTGRAIKKTSDAILAGLKQPGAATPIVSSHYLGGLSSLNDLLASRRVLQTMIQLIDNHISESGHSLTGLTRGPADTKDNRNDRG